MNKQQFNKLAKLTSNYYCLLAEVDFRILYEVDTISEEKGIPYHKGTKNLTENQLIEHLETLIECYKRSR